MCASFPVSAVTFAAYEFYLRDLMKYKQEEIFIK